MGRTRSISLLLLSSCYTYFYCYSYSNEGKEGECVFVKDQNWTRIDEMYNVLTPLNQSLCIGQNTDCCRCMTKKPPPVCEDVDGKCYNAFKKLGKPGFGVCIDVKKDSLADIDFSVPKQDGLCGRTPDDCCECFLHIPISG